MVPLPLLAEYLERISADSVEVGAGFASPGMSERPRNAGGGGLARRLEGRDSLPDQSSFLAGLQVVFPGRTGVPCTPRVLCVVGSGRRGKTMLPLERRSRTELFFFSGPRRSLASGMYLLNQ
jgi:hypothetical protein